MDVQKNKTIRRVSQCFLLFLALRILEELVIIPHVYDTMGLISSIGGLVVLLIYIRFINKPLEEIGMIFSGHKIRKGILLTILLNVVPTVLVYLYEFRYYSLQGGTAVFSIFYDKAERSYSSAGLNGFLIWTFAGLLIGVVNAFFYELSFRGLLITLGSRSLHFSAVNTIQAGLYTFWYLIPILRLVIYQSGRYSAKRLLVLLIVTLVYELLTGIKLGLLRFSTGSVWICIFDHIAFAFILDMVHVQYTDPSMNVELDARYYFRIIAYQVIALIIASVYYSYKKKKIHEMHQTMLIENNA